jgi:hypothetical protein
MQNSPFQEVDHLLATCPFCGSTTNFQSKTLRLDVGYQSVNVEVVPISHLENLNYFAPYMCEHCAGLFYFSQENFGIVPTIFFGDVGLVRDGNDFKHVCKSNPFATHSVFIIRGTFGCGKTELTHKIIRESPMKSKTSILEIEDQMGRKLGSMDIVKNEANLRALAIAKFGDYLKTKTDNIIVSGLLLRLKDVEEYLSRVEEAPLNYGVQVINLNHKKYKTQRMASAQIIETYRERFEP